MHICQHCGDYCDCNGEILNSLLDGRLTIACIHDCQDEYDDIDYDDLQEKENEDMAECTCGAYQWSQKQGKFVLVADCICGRV